MNNLGNPSAPTKARYRPALLLLVPTLLLGACATQFSPEMVRQEIRTQQGTDPLSAFELNLGRFTTLLLKTALAGEDGEVPFAGLGRLQLAVYESPSDRGPVIDAPASRLWAGSRWCVSPTKNPPAWC